MLAHGPSTRNMTPLEYMGNLVLLIVGGNDTTRNSMTGGLLALIGSGLFSVLLVVSRTPGLNQWLPVADFFRVAKPRVGVKASGEVSRMTP